MSGTAREHRESLLGQRGCVVWLTGLSGSGKSTVARALEERLAARGRLVYVLDGDVLRQGLNAGLGFDESDRRENVRRAAEVAALFAEAGVVTLCAFISPYARERALARTRAGDGRYLEVFLDTPLHACEERDPKGLYRKARSGALAELTGVAAPYERPQAPELVLDTSRVALGDCVERIVERLAGMRLVGANGDALR
jgi:adenylyl-sulfate kinase